MGRPNLFQHNLRTDCSWPCVTALIKDVCVSVRVSVCVCMGVCGEGTWRGGEKRENSGENMRFVEDGGTVCCG